MKRLRLFLKHGLIAIALFFSVSLLAEDLVISAWVKSVDQANYQFTLEAIEIESGVPDFSWEETIIADVYAGDIAVGYEGKRVRGVLSPMKSGYRLEFIWPDDDAMMKPLKAINNRLIVSTEKRGDKAYRILGERLPPFGLINQNAEPVNYRSFRGKYVVLNFIFTRCAIAHMCPAATSRMIRFQKEAQAQGIEDLVFVSVTFDPEFDTPGILNSYGSARGIDFENFHLLTGDKLTIEHLIKQVGVYVFPEEDTLNHSMSTVLVDKKGVIIHRVNGSRWSILDFLGRVSPE